MRSLPRVLMLLSMVLGSVVLGAACSWVSPDQCWRNSSDGFGGGGPIPIGAGVGATSSGDFSTPPEPGPQNNTDKPNPCETPDNSGGSGTSGSADPFAGIDAPAFARVELAGEYAAYTLAGLVQQQVADPSTLDEATANALIDQYLPQAWSDAQQWSQGLDPASIATATPTPKKECVTTYGYDEVVNCYFQDGKPTAECIVTNCGKGACPVCPKIFNLDTLIVHSWAVHTCVRDGSIIGVRITLKIALLQNLYRCIKLETPVP